MIAVEARYIPAPDPSLPALAIQITRLVDSYMLWVGTTELEAQDVAKAPLFGGLSKDWACAMPPNKVCNC
jgi:proteasome assembly chaperone 4